MNLSEQKLFTVFFDISMMDAAGRARHNNPDLEKWWDWWWNKGSMDNECWLSSHVYQNHVHLSSVQWNLALAIANLRKGLRLVFSSPHPWFAELGKSKNVNLDFLFVDNIM